MFVLNEGKNIIVILLFLYGMWLKCWYHQSKIKIEKVYVKCRVLQEKYV